MSDSVAAEKPSWHLLLTIRSRLTVQMAGHVHKHNALRPEEKLEVVSVVYLHQQSKRSSECVSRLF